MAMRAGAYFATPSQWTNWSRQMPIGVNVSLLVNAALVYSASHIYDPQNALLLAVLFTALFVSVLFSKSYRKGAGKQGAPALWRIIWAHSVFLAILLGFIWLASR